MPALLYCLEDGTGWSFWTLLYHAEYLWHLPKNFYDIMAQGDKQLISMWKYFWKTKVVYEEFYRWGTIIYFSTFSG